MKNSSKVVISSLCICLVFWMLGFLSGRISGIRTGSLRVISTAHWQKLNLVLEQVDRNYVDTLNYSNVTDAALSAALQKLDPHSVYMLPEPLKEADQNLAGGFEGVGLQFNVPNDTAVVIAVIPSGPSEKAGLMAGDRILKVDDRNIAGCKTPQDTMVRLMRGKRGTKVTLTIGRANERIPFEIVRDKISEHCVDASFMINDTTGYVRLSKFTRTTYSECVTAISSLVEQGMKHLVFDLRGNTGGYFDQACAIADEFLPSNSLIVYMEGLHRKREDVYADARGRFHDIGLSVLIDDGSASASEIFAGAIQDNDRGMVVGRRSFGKGLVQEPVYFSDGSGIRLTVARFYTPSGRCIQKPYSDDYEYDFYKRYAGGELTSADSIKVDSTKVYLTTKGRKVYGGGGIIPDIFVPLDTTRATNFYIDCNKKALTVRFATKFLDMHRATLLSLTDYNAVSRYLDTCNLQDDFLSYAATQGVVPKKGEWEASRSYLMPQVRGLCARYSKVGEEAYYRELLPVDNIIQAAVNHSAAE